MKVLIIGSGGREHAIAWKMKQSKSVKQVFVAPGNAGMQDVATIIDISIDKHEALIEFAIENRIDLTVIGPEQPLMDGLADKFLTAGLKVFGPTRKAAEIEGSKQFAKDLMKRYQIPTASYEVFTDYDKAKEYVCLKGAPIVVKADGLAAGKGVVVAMDIETALKALETMFSDSYCKVVIEEFLEGEEFSLMAFVNGNNVYPMVIAQDHKRAYDGDKGPNTGGMGAYSPVTQITQKVIKETVETIMVKTAEALVSEGRSFTGVLYGGIMLTKDGPRVIEFNARFGDPETEVILPRLKNDLFYLINNCLSGKVVDFIWDDDATLGVVMASNGYPGNYEKGYPIMGLEDLSDVQVFHMGTKMVDNKIVTNGGRVLIVVGKAKNLKMASLSVKNALNQIQCENLFYRNDIGYRNLNLLEANQND